MELATSLVFSQSKCDASFDNVPVTNRIRVSLPALKQVQGGFVLQSTKDITQECNHFKSIAGPTNVIRGRYGCLGKVDSAAGQGSLSDGTNSGGGDGSSGASSLAISGMAGVLCVVATIFGML